MRNYKTLSKFVAIAILAVGLTGCANTVTSLTGQMEESVIGEGSGSGELVTKWEKSFATGDFDRIQVKTEAMAVYVTQNAGDRAEVKLLVDKSIDNRFNFDASVKSKELQIQVDEENESFRLSSKGQKGERKLLLSLPDKLYDQVKIQNDFGLVDVKDLETDRTEINVSAGSIRLNRVSGVMKLETNAGEIVAEGIRLENDLSAKTDVGEIKIQLDQTPVNAKLNLQSDVGKVTADLENIDYNVNATNEKIGSIGSKGPLLEAHTNVGSIRVDAK